MKKLISFICVVLFSVTANATLISVELDKNTYQVGETVTADIIVTGSSSFDFSYLIGTLALDVIFDEQLVTFDTVVFGDKMNTGNPLDWFFGYQSVIPGAGIISLEEQSDLLFDDLYTLQGGLSSFSFATLTFTASKVGSGVFDLTTLFLGDAYGDTLVSTTLPASYNVASATSVPEPSTIALFSVLGLLVLRRKV